MFYRITAFDLHQYFEQHTDSKIVEVGRVRIDADEHPGGVRLIGSTLTAMGSVIVNVEVADSPTFGNDDREPGYFGQFVLKGSSTLGLIGTVRITQGV